MSLTTPGSVVLGAIIIALAIHSARPRVVVIVPGAATSPETEGR